MADYEKQIAELKKEMGQISKAVSARASGMLEGAEEVYDDMKDQARRQAGVVSGVARDNPGTAATVALSIGLLGVLAGMALCMMAGGSRKD